MSAPLLDRAVIDDLFDFIGVKAVRPVIELFLSESRELVGRIEQSAADDPAGREAIRRAAHSLKSGAGQVGAAALSESGSRGRARRRTRCDRPSCHYRLAAGSRRRDARRVRQPIAIQISIGSVSAQTVLES